VPLGRDVERTGEAGAAELLLRLLSQQINERLGPAFTGRLQTDQDVDFTRFTLRVLSDDWQAALTALLEALRQPRLDAAAIALSHRPHLHPAAARPWRCVVSSCRRALAHAGGLSARSPDGRSGGDEGSGP